jgi:hypothetical protein
MLFRSTEKLWKLKLDSKTNPPSLVDEDGLALKELQHEERLRA